MLKQSCDNCYKDIESLVKTYGIVFVIPNESSILRPFTKEKMLCQECFVEFYTKAGFKWHKENEKRQVG